MNSNQPPISKEFGFLSIDDIKNIEENYPHLITTWKKDDNSPEVKQIPVQVANWGNGSSITVYNKQAVDNRSKNISVGRLFPDNKYQSSGQIRTQTHSTPVEDDGNPF